MKRHSACDPSTRSCLSQASRKRIEGPQTVLSPPSTLCRAPTRGQRNCHSCTHRPPRCVVVIDLFTYTVPQRETKINAPQSTGIPAVWSDFTTSSELADWPTTCWLPSQGIIAYFVGRLQDQHVNLILLALSDELWWKRATGPSRKQYPTTYRRWMDGRNDWLDVVKRSRIINIHMVVGRWVAWVCARFLRGLRQKK